jgi:hypothetical protein
MGLQLRWRLLFPNVWFPVAQLLLLTFCAFDGWVGKTQHSSISGDFSAAAAAVADNDDFTEEEAANGTNEGSAEVLRKFSVTASF